ncbi:adenylate isopentenyltransferase 3, chloroplastic-like [Silene latifolia]|uniref:adenylate isopentenyltransferase 3, chloroplastic-like n=1 Tax=Silene latifolia TaxID=37657 RepID=UPI003D775CC6
MRNPMQMWKQAEQLLRIPSPALLNMEVIKPWQKPRDKVVFIMGATGTGKSRLSIDLATRFSAEIINSDKIQAYKGLDIVTNKVTMEEQCGIPHHLLGILQPNNIDFTTRDFCLMATHAVESILKKDKLPIIVGGSNTYIESLMTDPIFGFNSKYECCFLWVDVSVPVLRDFVSHRVDKMVESGLVQEVREMFDPTNTDYTRGIRRAIGVSELDKYFRSGQVQELQVAINEIKENTCVLANRQLEKIYRLKDVKGWELNRVDATEVFDKMTDKVAADEAWDRLITKPAYKIVNKFLRNQHGNFESNLCAKVVKRSTIPSNQTMITASSVKHRLLVD